MSRVVYTGLCIGGPMAGKLATMPTPVLAIEQQPPRRLRPLKPGEGSGVINFVTERYRWMDVMGQGFWTLEGTTAAEAINELAMAYQEHHK